MGFPRFDSGLCFDAANAPDKERLAGPALAPLPPADWTAPGISNTLWAGPNKGNTVDTWKDANGYGGGAVTGTKVSGIGGTITQDTPVAGTATLDDPAGAFVANMAQGSITISGATAPGNNGLWQVVAVNSPTQLEYLNPAAVTVAEPFNYDTNVADTGYGADPTPTESWRFDVDLPAGWYTRTAVQKSSRQQ